MTQYHPDPLPADAGDATLADFLLTTAKNYHTRGRQALSFAVLQPGFVLTDAATAIQRAADRLAARSLTGTRGLDGEDIAIFSNACPRTSTPMV
jgi:hypothetical protein